MHTHSIISYDGSIDEKGYERLLATGIIDCTAITDHQEVSFAIAMRKKFGEKVIVGEEIDTFDGQLIGLFLQKKVPSGLSAKETCDEIHAQGGLVYVPHPFERKRWSMQRGILDEIHRDIDIVEGFNARGFLRENQKEAQSFAKQYGIPTAASSDAHSYRGMGTAYSILVAIPTSKTLPSLLQRSRLHKRYSGIFPYLSPKITKLRRKLNA